MPRSQLFNGNDPFANHFSAIIDRSDRQLQDETIAITTVVGYQLMLKLPLKKNVYKSKPTMKSGVIYPRLFLTR